MNGSLYQMPALATITVIGPEFGAHCVIGGDGLLSAGYVELARKNCCSGGAQLCAFALERGIVEIEHRHPVSAAGKQRANARADARSSAGDDNYALRAHGFMLLVDGLLHRHPRPLARL